MARHADYRASEHIAPTDDLYTQPAFPLSNRLKRLVWNITWLVLLPFLATTVPRMARDAAAAFRRDNWA